MRPSGRAPDQLRPVSLEPGFSRHAEGSCLVKFGDTHVLCTASVDERVPPWMRNTGKGWVTAEYGMLPRSTHTRTDREAARGKQSGRTQEIQRLIGRSLRAVVDLTAMGERQRGVLRRSVPLWLAQPDLSQIVLSYGAAGTRHGGAGAFYVRLRKATRSA